MLRQGQLKPGAPISERPAGPLTAQCLAVPGRRAMNFFVGLDWASQAHAVCVLDATGQVCWQGSAAHSADGLAEPLRRLARLGTPASGALANQLRALLDRFWPGAAAIFADVDSPIALAFLSRYPTPHSAERLGEKRLARFLVQHAYCGRRPAAELLARLRSAPITQTSELEAEASGEIVRALVTVLLPLVTQIQQLSTAIAAALPQHPDGPLLQSFPRSGRVNAAQILAELGDDRSRFATDEQLAAEGGVAPVTRESGKHRGVAFRRACNKRLRQALTSFADHSRHASPWAAALYAAARRRGCHHPHAIGESSRAGSGNFRSTCSGSPSPPSRPGSNSRTGRWSRSQSQRRTSAFVQPASPGILTCSGERTSSVSPQCVILWWATTARLAASVASRSSGVRDR